MHLLIFLGLLFATDPKALIDKLHQPHPSSDADRRALLKKIGADVPNAKGTFETPPRPRDEKKPPGELDWLEALNKEPDSPALADSVDVVTTLRALADTKAEAAADAILDFAFTPDGLVYRDECGRQLRNMSPWSLPTLMRASQDKKRDGGSYARYASYQLDRVRKNVPSDALAAAPNDELEVAMLRAIRDVKHPDAVSAVLDLCNAPSHTVRKAAREAWMAYVTGPPPPPAPKAFRKLPGGKLSKKPEPLYLTYRELADNELRRVLLALTSVTQPEDADVEAMTKQLFDIYDQKRAEAWDEQMKAASALLAKNDWEGAAAQHDEILMQDPTYAHRADMVPGYLALGRHAAKQAKWDQAVQAFFKAWSLDPSGPKAKEAEAELFHARGERARKAGKGGDDDLARGAAADPVGVKAAAETTSSSGRTMPIWVLWAGLAGGAVGLFLVLAGLMRRRT